jgi:hypothetical protein
MAAYRCERVIVNELRWVAGLLALASLIVVLMRRKPKR